MLEFQCYGNIKHLQLRTRAQARMNGSEMNMYITSDIEHRATPTGMY